MVRKRPRQRGKIFVRVPSGFFQNSFTDCRRRSTSQTVYSLCSYVTGWHGADSARIEISGRRKTKRDRPSFEKLSTTIL
jgi:hypothetical protein